MRFERFTGTLRNSVKIEFNNRGRCHSYREPGLPRFARISGTGLQNQIDELLHSLECSLRSARWCGRPEAWSQHRSQDLDRGMMTWPVWWPFMTFLDLSRFLLICDFHIASHWSSERWNEVPSPSSYTCLVPAIWHRWPKPHEAMGRAMPDRILERERSRHVIPISSQ